MCILSIYTQINKTTPICSPDYRVSLLTECPQFVSSQSRFFYSLIDGYQFHLFANLLILYKPSLVDLTPPYMSDAARLSFLK